MISIIDESKNIDNDKMCIICWYEIGIIILCNNCKYLYCKKCAKKINNTCSICFRSIKIDNLNDFYSFDHDSFYIYELVNLHYSVIVIGIFLTSIILSCILFFILIIKYLFLKFLLKLLYLTYKYFI